jgi:hypothetical protein
MGKMNTKIWLVVAMYNTPATEIVVNAYSSKELAEIAKDKVIAMHNEYGIEGRVSILETPLFEEVI